MEKLDRNFDIDSLRYDRDEYKRKMNMAWKQTAEYESQVINLKAELGIMVQKVLNAEEDAKRAREIMTKQILEFNQYKHNYIGEIQELKNKLKELKK